MGKGIPKELLDSAIENSLSFVVLEKRNEKNVQVGFALLLTDYATMAEIIKHPRLQGLRRMLLATSDAHGLYQQLGLKR